jgi:hypothetical protein
VFCTWFLVCDTLCPYTHTPARAPIISRLISGGVRVLQHCTAFPSTWTPDVAVAALEPGGSMQVGGLDLPLYAPCGRKHPLP